MPLAKRRSASKSLVIGAAALGLAALGLGAAETSGAATPLYQDRHAPASARAADLVKHLSLDEQLGQLVQIQVGKLYGDCGGYTPGPLNNGCAQDVLATDLAGSILSGGGDVPGAG